eukprot:249405-Amorphochlora_amoeboformis.AAC.1
MRVPSRILTSSWRDALKDKEITARSIWPRSTSNLLHKYPPYLSMLHNPPKLACRPPGVGPGSQ